MSTLPPDSRFASPTSGLDPATLLRPLRKVFLVSIGAALALHLVIVVINPFEQAAQKAPRPLTTKFIKREPRLTKPLELRKLPQPKRQMVRRQVQLARARMDQVQATATFNTRGLITQVATAAPQARLGQAGPSATLASMNLEPSLSAAAVTGVRSPDNKIDLGLEMMDVNSMDTGRYRAMVIQDPEDPQALKGFVKFASVTSARSIDFGSGGGFGQGFIDRTRDALNQFTGLQSEYVGLITFDDERLLEVPIIFRANPGNESEKERMVEYLLAGGFVCGGVGDNWEGLEKYGGLVRGKDFWSERLPDDHPIYSAFFDLERGGPPSRGGTASGKAGTISWATTRGYFIKGRLAGITFDRVGWTEYLIVNVIVYALTQEGSMTQRLMHMVN
ncbi:MAG: DUF4159 domain-containing protein [Gemmatimonadetes bacterium]|nr:DUF4159 domain-containing protein [Gemmatimonadota bacterium]